MGVLRCTSQWCLRCSFAADAVLTWNWQQQDPIQGVAGWFGNLASTVAGQFDEIAHAGHKESAASDAAPAFPASGGGGGWGKAVRQRSEDEQRAFELKVLPGSCAPMAAMQSAPLARHASPAHTHPQTHARMHTHAHAQKHTHRCRLTASACISHGPGPARSAILCSIHLASASPHPSLGMRCKPSDRSAIGPSTPARPPSCHTRRLRCHIANRKGPRPTPRCCTGFWVDNTPSSAPTSFSWPCATSRSCASCRSTADE